MCARACGVKLKISGIFPSCRVELGRKVAETKAKQWREGAIGAHTPFKLCF